MTAYRDGVGPSPKGRGGGLGPSPSESDTGDKNMRWSRDTGVHFCKRRRRGESSAGARHDARVVKPIHQAAPGRAAVACVHRAAAENPEPCLSSQQSRPGRRLV